MKKILKIAYLVILFLLLWNFFFDKEGIISYIKMKRKKQKLLEEINTLNAKKAVLLHKKNFIESKEGLKTILILRFGKTEILKGGSDVSKNN